MSTFLKPRKTKAPPSAWTPNPITEIFDAERRRQAVASSATASTANPSINRQAGDSSLASANQPQCPNKSCKDPKVVDGVCRTCGRVADDSNIVAEVQFGESSTGAAIVQGSYMGADQGGVRPLGPVARFMAGHSREKSINEARLKMQGFAQQLNINEPTVKYGVQIFKLASGQNFVQGRPLPVVAAVCLYAACRSKRPCKVMLIDFADLVQVNVFKLGSTFKALREAASLYWDGMQQVFPEDLIYRFAATLEFGHFTNKVAETAVRLVQRMSRDWMVMGRRPSGICGACLIMAARMYNFRRTVREVVYIVKVTSHTIQKRLEEFNLTESSKMTVEDFLTQDFLESAHDPPSFYQKSEEYQRLKQQRGRKRKRAARGPDDGGYDYDEEADEPEPSRESTVDREGLRDTSPRSSGGQSAPGTAANAATATPAVAGTPPDLANLPPVEYRRDADGFIIPPLPPKDVPVDPALLDPEAPESLDSLARDFGDAPNDGAGSSRGVASTTVENGRGTAKGPSRGRRAPVLNIDQDWEQDEEELEQHISEIINDPHSLEHAKVFSTAEQRARVHAMWARSLQPQRVVSMDAIVGEDEFVGDPEVENCLLSAEEVKSKELIWVNVNKDWLRQQQERVFRSKMAAAGPPKQTRKRRKRARIGEGQTAPAETAADAAVNVLKDRAFSKRINYDAIRSLFEFGGRGPGSVASVGSEVTSRRTSRAGSPTTAVEEDDGGNGGVADREADVEEVDEDEDDALIQDEDDDGDRDDEVADEDYAEEYGLLDDPHRYGDDDEEVMDDED